LPTKQSAEQFSVNGNNFTTENHSDKPIEIPVNNSIINPTILAIDLGIKAPVNQLDSISSNLGIQLEKSAQLASKWESIKSKLDVYIKSLQGISYKKVFTYTAGTIAVLYLVYQCSIYRKLPDFLISIASHIPLPSVRSSEIRVSILIPTVENTLNNLTNMPITPLGIVTGVGIIVTSLTIIKATLWIICKLSK